ncbi:hypothetical protein Desku_1402 [Desulfofundulus kuznetsovii DSM 6115]|jgi:hypothetical protein|uniref:Uncharacterized protein n=1 Tax=Desulfofundulus kuznetsovii (strain DSM 6115 / VKM B-1805 / 17) TaxID=760568 RepID=A0AAU8PAK8_DESK7|nr:hypothetical protein Desku_1402 [Desulfofundulus kuznetsovii DSM 6115]
MKIVPHPVVFLNKAESDDRERAKEELKVIISSEPGSILNLYTFWYRQTRLSSIRAALEEFFQGVATGEN